jgi:hypothetical protein
MTRKKRIERTDAIIESILEGLEAGRTLTAICEDDGMPSISAVQKWQRHDTDLFDDIDRAWISGLRIRHDMNSDRQRKIMDDPSQHDPKIINALATLTRDVNHTLVAMLSRRDKRYSDKQQVENIGNTPVIIGWDHGGDRGIEHIDRKGDPLQIAVPDSTGGGARKH